MTIHLSYRKHDPEKVGTLGRRDVPIAVADPGASGVMMIWEEGLVGWPRRQTRRCSIGSNGSGHRQAAEWCEFLGVRTLLVEDQFLRPGKGAQSQIGLIRSGGMLVGAVQFACKELEQVIWIPPTAWQASMPAHADTKERSRMNAVRRLGPEWLKGQGPSTLQEACADVVGMLTFYEEVTRAKRDDDLGF